jgi:hypothetical protein
MGNILSEDRLYCDVWFDALRREAVENAIIRQGATPDHGGLDRRQFKAGDQVERDNVLATLHGEVYEILGGALWVRDQIGCTEPLTVAWRLTD